MRVLHTLLAGAFAFGAMSAAASAADYNFKIGHAASSKHAFNIGVEMFAEAVAEKTGGKVAIEVVGDRQLGDGSWDAWRWTTEPYGDPVPPPRIPARPIPEPVSAALVGFGLLGLAARRRRRVCQGR